MIKGEEYFYSNSPLFFSKLLKRYQITIYESQFDKKEEIIEAYVTINRALVKHTDEDLEKAMQLIQIKQ